MEVTLADMGYGLADVLPMLICFYYVQEGSTLILEQPGIHLHPMVQSQTRGSLDRGCQRTKTTDSCGKP